MNTMLKRIVSMFLCFVLVAGYLPAGALAAETEETVVTAAAEATNAPSVVELSDEATVVVEEEAAEAEENEEESLTADTGDPEEAVSEEANTSEEAPAEKETSDEVTSEEETSEEEITEEETSEEATEEAAAFVLEGDSFTAPLLDADAPVDAAIFFSDLHTNKSDYKETTVKGIMNGLKSSNLNFSSVTSCGDAFSVNEDSGKYTGDPSKITGYIRSVFADIPVSYVWSDHDRYAGLDNDSGFIYGAGADGEYGTADDGNYYIYELSMADLSTNNRYNADFHNNAEVTATIAAFVEDAAKLDQTKPLFIASHQPLLDRRNDNGHALEWATAINEVAEDMDVAFFFGHNHKYDKSGDYYYAKGSTMSVCKDQNGNAQDVKLNFTHLCTGYLAPASTNSTSDTTRQGTAMAVTIFEDSISYVTYDKNGVYNGSYALNETVTRDHAQAETVEPTEPTEPSQPSQPETPDVTIKDANGNDVEADVAVNNEASVQAAVADLLTNAVAYDIDIEGEVGDIVITLPAEGIANPAVYYVPVDGTPVDMNATKTADGKVSFHTSHNSTYAVGERAVSEDAGDTSTNRDPETATGSGSTTTTTKKTVYVLSNSISAGKEYLIVNGNRAGSYYALANNNGSVAATGVTVKTDSKIGTYIELDDAADELWTVASGYTFKNGNYYLGYTTSGNWGNTTYKFGLSTTERDWSYSNNRLSTSVGSWNSTTYYLRYDSGWTWTNSNSASGRSVYFYVPTEVEVETTTTASGTYSIAGNPAEVTKVVKNGSTVKLNSVLTFTPSDGGTATTTDPSTTATYTVVEGSDIISDITRNTVTFSGKTGEAVVKVSYITSFGEVSNYITVIAAEPTYVLDITKDETVVTSTTLTKKGVTATTTLQLGTKVQYMDENGTSPVDLPQGATIEWNIPEEYQTIATVDNNGLITFKGVDGAFYVTATLTVNGKSYTAGVNISATTSLYSVPSDHTSDFPEYPNEGAIRYDKTATAVGNFSQTGIAQLELSMTGVPYTTGSEMDVVLMLDRSSSMYKNGVQHRISSTVEATKAFIKNIVVNADGSFNNNRILVLDFLGGNLNTSAGGGSSHKFESNQYTTNEDSGYQIISNQAELDALLEKIEKDFKGQTSLYGTEYAQGLKACYDALNASRSDGNKQFCVFMSDGIPNYMQCETTHFNSTNDIVGMFNVTNRTAANGTATRNATKYEYEYYSTQMKNEGVTVFTVGLGLKNTNSAWSNTSKEVCEQVANMLLNDIAGPAYETELDRDTGNAVSKLNSYFYSVADDNAAADMKNVFAGIAQKILQAATDVTVEDQITPEYTMIFDIPTGDKTISGVTNDFYIEFGKYALDDNHERTTFTSVTKLYLQKTNGTLSAKDSTAPVFQQNTIGDKGTLYYWSTNASDGDAGVSVTVDGITYYFVSYGMETAGYNMVSGAYANGTVDSTTNMSEDLVIATPYFVYNAAKRMIYWTVDKLDTQEYVLRYFLYLNDSATEVGTADETDPGSYLTNDHAYITYTNFKGNDCRQEFPKPQLTWSGAQVSYVFYLVNAAGQPINKSGQVVDFANATFVTDVYTEKTVWNKGTDGKITADSQLSQEWLAKNLLPTDYKVYDEGAEYKLHVYGNHDGTSNFDYFIIDGNNKATIASSLNTRLNLNTTESSVSDTTTKVYNTKAGEKVTGYGTYTSKATDSLNNEIVKDNIDFYNTTVAFAVVWQPRLVPDAVVVDYGLDVLINVTQNDILQNKVSGIGLGNSAYGSIAMNSGVSTTSKLGTAALTLDGNTISIENENQIRFHQDDMEFKDPVVFYYESPVEFWEGSDPTKGYMHSSVTVIPATTIYYEDEFLSFAGKNGEVNTVDVMQGVAEADQVPGQWYLEGTKINKTQDQDRPGKSQISAELDADNNYGYDKAYENISTYSMGSAAKVHVDSNSYATATFDFWGTGFDVISMTSNTTGTIAVNVKDANGNDVANEFVNTYYGYTYDATTQKWIATPDTENALYQVPVIQIENLTYGNYTAKITATYMSALDKTTADGYDLYLDAIRIYDPAGTTYGGDGNIDPDIQDAYIADGEGWPTYYEVRNMIIEQSTDADLGDDAVEGIVFIDGVSGCKAVADYTSYGPNNETYLAVGQAIAFSLSQDNVEKIQLAVKTVGGTASIKVYSIDNVTALDKEINTATDMYYDITSMNGETVVIMNDGESGILSITNVKITHTAAPNSGAKFLISRPAVNAVLATMNVEEEVPETTEPSVPETTVPETTEPEETKPVKPDNSELKAAVEEARKIKQKGHTQASFKKLQTAIKAAEKVLKDKKATQAQIDKALADLNAAVDALETVEVKPTTPKPGASGGKFQNDFMDLDSIMNIFRNLQKGNKK